MIYLLYYNIKIIANPKMEKIIKKRLVIFLLFIILDIFIFWKFFFGGLYPFPGNYLLSWYEPWKSENFSNGVITLAHKPVADDVFRQIYPFKTLAADIFKRFEPPLWNPYNGAGMPLLATINTGLLSPSMLLFLFLPNYLSWSISIIIQPILIGYFTYLFCRKISLSFMASLFASITFVLSGFTVVRLIYEVYGIAIASLPLTLYLIECYLQNNKTKLIYLLPIVLSILIASTQPQISLYIISFLIIYYLYRFLSKERNFKRNLKKFLFPLLLIMLGFGLSSVQLIPTFELFKQANINTASSSFIFEQFLLPIQHFLTLFIPNYFGNLATYNFWGPGGYIQSSIYLGIIPCFFAYIGIFNISKIKIVDLRKLFLIIIVLTIISCIDWFGSRFLFSLPIPIISTGIPSRIFLITIFCLVILAGYGFDNLYFEKIANFPKLLIKKVGFFLAFIIFLLLFTLLMNPQEIPCINNIIKNCQGIALRNTLLQVIPSMLFIITALIVILKLNKKFYSISKILALLIVLFLGLYNVYKFMPFSPKETFLPTNNLLRALTQNTLNSRVFGIGEANLPTNIATYFRIYDPQYYHPLYIRRYGELINYANSGKVGKILSRSDVGIIKDTTVSASLEVRRNRLLNLLGIRYLIFKKFEVPKGSISINNILWEDNTWYVKINNFTLPRAYLVSNYEVATDNQKILEKLFSESFDASSNVILEKEPKLSIAKNDEKIQQVKIKNYQENKIQIESDSSSNGILVLSDNYYPDWKAFIDGKETTILRANYSFRAIEVPKGKHKIVMSYNSPSFKIGLLISSSFLLIYLALFLRIFFKK
ncbi:MAG: YfhO family protein [Candidatus Levyibacteriota bacterium]